MKTLLELGLRGVAGGLFVVVFALIAEVFKPKMFSGLFSAAPSVALASLLLTGLSMGSAKASLAATGMIAGALAMVACTAVAAYSVWRLGALRGTALGWLAWLVVALGIYPVALR